MAARVVRCACRPRRHPAKRAGRPRLVLRRPPRATSKIPVETAAPYQMAAFRLPVEAGAARRDREPQGTPEPALRPPALLVDKGTTHTAAPAEQVQRGLLLRRSAATEANMALTAPAAVVAEGRSIVQRATAIQARTVAVTELAAEAAVA